MASLIFLAVAAIIIAIGVTVIWMRDRIGSRFDSSIDRFEAEMGALAPVRVRPARRSSGRGGSGRS
ncbi:MAG: hypothetical protein RIE08_03405 [Acidimicrobiales bacterium]